MNHRGRLSAEDYAATCAGKGTFESHGAAIKHQARIRERRRNGATFAKLRPYRCPYCHKWHLGTPDEEWML